MRGPTIFFLLISTLGYSQSIINTSAISHDLDSALSLVIDAGADFSRGNSSVNNITSSFGIGKSVSEDASLWILGGFNQLAVNGTTQQQASYGHVRLNYEINERVTLNTYGQYQANSVLAIDNRILTGANIDIDLGKEQDFMLALGAFQEFESYRDGLSSSLVRANVVAVAEHKTERVQIVGFAYYQPSLQSLTDFRCIGEVSLRFPLSNNLQLTLNTATRFDSSPHSGLTSTDIGLTTSLRYKLHS